MSHRTNHSYLHRPGAEPLQGATTDEMFRTSAREHADSPALVSIPQRRRFTYAKLDKEVDRVARALLALRVRKGDRIGIWSTNNAEWIMIQLATARIGAILVNINPAYRSAELTHALKLAEVQVLFFIPRFKSSDYLGMIREVCPEVAERPADAFSSRSLPALHHIIMYEPEAPEETAAPDPGILAWPKFTAGAARIAPDLLLERAASLNTDDPTNIQFTSGTTGFPKAVVLSHHNIVNNAWLVGAAMHLTHEDRLCVPLPFYHCFGMVLSTLLCIVRGATVVIPSEHFDAAAALRAIEQERCTAVHGVPTMFVAMLAEAEETRSDLSSLRTGIMAGAPCPPDLMRRVMNDMGCSEILIGFGQTEASPITHITSTDDTVQRRVETVGRPSAHQECKIVEPETGATVPLGITGEICVRGYNVMRGYYNQPDATHATIDERGWLHTGDLGAMDEDGYLRITGRLKDMIIRGGENIYPAEVEAFYYEHPKIAEIAVFGVPHPKYGEEVGAWVRLREGEAAAADELRAFAEGRIAHYKIPRHFWFVAEFPMTVTGKIRKSRIREIVAQQMHEALEASPQTLA